MMALALAGVALTTVQPADAAKTKGKPCVTTQEMAALDGRVLESDLLVGALSCGQSQPYNAFVEKFRPAMTERARTVQAMFQRFYGKGSNREFDAFVTRLGNDSALRSIQMQLEFCRLTMDVFEEGEVTPANAYDVLFNKPAFAGRHGYAACGADGGKKGG
jgi:hypothetical protein